MGNFKLEWSDFEQNLAASFKQLRAEGDLLDVTLVCDDEQLKAHKVILSAASVFFKSVIKKNPHTHPLIYMKGVKLEDMRALLDFIYLGQTKVGQENVQAFLRLGEELGVTGLSEEKLEEEEEEEERKDENTEQTDSSLEQGTEPDKSITEPEGNFLSLEVKQEGRPSSGEKQKFDNSHQIAQEVPAAILVQEHVASMKQHATRVSDLARNSNKFNINLDGKIESSSKAESQIGYECSKCNKLLKTRQNLQKHAEIHMEGLSYPCKYCERAYSTKNSLQGHTYRKHMNKTLDS